MARLSGLAFFYAKFVLLVVNLCVDPHPCWRCLFNHFVGGAIWKVRARQVSSAHQKFPGDLAAGELKRLLKKLNPFGFGHWMMCFNPFRETAMAVTHCPDALGVFDDGVDL